VPRGMVLVDTNVVSYVFKSGPRSESYARLLLNRIPAVSLVTIGELLYGVRLARWGPTRSREFESKLHRYVVISHDYDVAATYARVMTIRRQAGRPITTNDAWIAATAVRHNLPLVTHNRRDFDDIPGLDILSEA